MFLLAHEFYYAKIEEKSASFTLNEPDQKKSVFCK